MFINFGGIFMKASCVPYHKHTAIVTVEAVVGVVGVVTAAAAATTYMSRIFCALSNRYNFRL